MHCCRLWRHALWPAVTSCIDSHDVTAQHELLAPSSGSSCGLRFSCYTAPNIQGCCCCSFGCVFNKMCLMASGGGATKLKIKKSKLCFSFSFAARGVCCTKTQTECQWSNCEYMCIIKNIISVLFHIYYFFFGIFLNKFILQQSGVGRDI